MGLLAHVASLDDLPESLHEFYVQSDDGYRLSVDGMVDKSKVDEFRDNNIALQKQLEGYDGVDPKKYRSMEKRLKDLEQQSKADKAGISAAELDKLRAEVREDLEAGEYAELRATNERLADDNRKLRLDNVVKKHMADQGARPERLDALFKLTADAYDLTDDGKPYIKGRPATEVSKYIGDVVKSEYPEMFLGSGSSGSGASASNAGGGGQSVIPADDNDAFIGSLEDIASGKVTVPMEIGG